MDHFRVKLFAVTSPGFALSNAIPVFHRWIQNKVLSELLIDVADYRHVPDGPGVLLVAHEAHYSLDANGTLLYGRRTTLSGTPASKISQAWESAMAAASILESEQEFTGKILFDRRRFEISVNDRLLAPNTPESRAALEPELRRVLDQAWGSGAYQLYPVGEPRDLLTFAAERS
jgi:hypothetical protein